MLEQEYTRADVQESIVRIDLLTFFQANPHTRDTASGLARRLYRPLQEVAAAADTLVRIGILEKSVNSISTVYRLRNGEMLSSFYENLSNNEGEGRNV